MYSTTGAGCVATRFATLAVSRLDPPPTPTNPSNPPSIAKSVASWKDPRVGSTRTRSKTSHSMPSASMISRILSVIPTRITPGSETSITRLAPSRFISHPASSEAPGPNVIEVDSSLKALSRSEARRSGTDEPSLLRDTIPLTLALGGHLGFFYRGGRPDYISVVRLRGEVSRRQAYESYHDHVADEQPRFSPRVPEQRGCDGRRKSAREYPGKLVDGPDTRVTHSGVEQLRPEGRQGSVYRGVDKAERHYDAQPEQDRLPGVDQ